MNREFCLCGYTATCIFALQAFTSGALAATVPLTGAPYSVPDKYVSTSYGDTIEEAVAIWWPKYQQYFEVRPYGTLQCGHEITYGGEGAYGAVGRVRVNGQCRGSDVIYGTPYCPAGYDLVEDLCQENGELIEEKEKPDDCTTTSHPVHFTTGTKYLYETDAATPGNEALALKRSWNSRDKQWRFDYTQRISIASSSLQVASVYRSDGTVVNFTESPTGWFATADVTDILESSGSGWLYTLHSGQREWYDSLGRLTQVQPIDGRIIRVSYAAAGEKRILDEYDNALRLIFDGTGRVIESYDQAGGHIRYAYDDRGNLVYVSYPDATVDQAGSNPFGEDNPFREYHYEDTNSPDLITGITDENGERHSTVKYDASGRAISSGLADGSVNGSSIDYAAVDDTQNPFSVVTNTLGKDTVYHLQNVLGVRKVVAVEGVASANCLADISTRAYDPFTGWLQSAVDRAGNTTTHTYYRDPGRYGLLRQRIEGAGTAQQRTMIYNWDATNRQLLQQTLQDYSRTALTYHSNGRLASRTETDLSISAVPYSTNGRSRTWNYYYQYHDPDTQNRPSRLTVDGPRNDVSDVTVYDYNAQGFLSRITDAAGNQTSYIDHNGLGQPTRIVDPNGVETHLYYSPRGWLLRRSVDTGTDLAVTDLARDSAGRLTRLTMPTGSYFDLEYDSSDRLVALQNTHGEYIRFILDNASSPVAIDFEYSDGSLSHDLNFEYDELGRILRNVGSHGQVVGYSYDVNGNTAAIAPGNGQVFDLGHDALGRLTRLTYPDTSQAAFISDSQGHLVSVTDQRGLTTQYIYDGLGNLKQRTSPDTGSSTYTWDEAGNLLSETDARGVEAHYTWDALNRLVTVQYPSEPGSNVDLAWDNGPGCQSCNSRLRQIVDASGATSFKYDHAGRIVHRVHTVSIQNRGALDLVTRFSYDMDGLLTAVKHPNGEEVSYQRDASGRATGISRLQGDNRNTVLENIAYQPFGQPLQGLYGNGLLMDRDYDMDGRLIRQRVTGVQDRSYSFDNIGNLWHIDDLLSPSRSQGFSYDLLNRLVNANGIYGEVGYDYDAVGNRTLRTLQSNSELTSETYQYFPNSNQLQGISILRGGETRQRNFSYDSSGNVIEGDRGNGNTLRATYDANRRMIQVSP